MSVEFLWDTVKAQSNRKKHGVEFVDAIAVFEDETALTMPVDYPDEERYITLG